MTTAIITVIITAAILCGIHHVWSKWMREAEEDGVIEKK